MMVDAALERTHDGLRGDVTAWVLAGGILAAAVAICAPAFANLTFLWSGSQFYGHAYAVPVVAFLLVYQRRSEILAALRDLRPAHSGGLVLGAVASLEALFVIGDVGSAAALTAPLVLAAGLYAVGGWPLLRPLALPLFFLVTIVPPPRFLTYDLLFHLKIVVTESAVVILRGLGKTVLAEGNLILLPEATLFVADACSGLTSIVALAPLAIIVAYFMGRGVWRRLVIVASVVPMAMAANVLRVAGTVMMVSFWGPEYAQGSLHETFGLLTTVVGTCAVIGVARIVR